MHCRAADSTGIKVEGEGEWHARKHGGPKRRVWRKIHLGIDEEHWRFAQSSVNSISNFPKTWSAPLGPAARIITLHQMQTDEAGDEALGMGLPSCLVVIEKVNTSACQALISVV